MDGIGGGDGRMQSQARVVSYIQGQLPASDADIAAGTRIGVHGFIGTHLL